MMQGWIPPGILLGGLLCVVYAALFHLWAGRSLADLVGYLAAALLGFIVGQLFGEFLGLHWGQIGLVHVPEATLFAWLAMAGLHAYSRRTP